MKDDYALPLRAFLLRTATQWLRQLDAQRYPYEAATLGLALQHAEDADTELVGRVLQQLEAWSSETVSVEAYDLAALGYTIELSRMRGRPDAALCQQLVRKVNEHLGIQEPRRFGLLQSPQFLHAVATGLVNFTDGAEVTGHLVRGALTELHRPDLDPGAFALLSAALLKLNQRPEHVALVVRRLESIWQERDELPAGPKADILWLVLHYLEREGGDRSHGPGALGEALTQWQDWARALLLGLASAYGIIDVGPAPWIMEADLPSDADSNWPTPIEQITPHEVLQLFQVVAPTVHSYMLVSRTEHQALRRYAKEKDGSTIPALLTAVLLLLMLLGVAVSALARWSAVVGLCVGVLGIWVPWFGRRGSAVWYPKVQTVPAAAITSLVTILLAGLIQWLENHHWLPADLKSLTEANGGLAKILFIFLQTGLSGVLVPLFVPKKG